MTRHRSVSRRKNGNPGITEKPDETAFCGTRRQYEIATPVMLQPSRPRHFARDINHGRVDAVAENGLQPGGVINAVLQTQDKGIVSEKGTNRLRRAFGVRRFDAKKDELRVGNPFRVLAGGKSHPLMEGFRFHLEAALTNRHDVPRPADQHDIMTRTGQHSPKIAADSSRPHDSNFHLPFLRNHSTWNTSACTAKDTKSATRHKLLFLAPLR